MMKQIYSCDKCGKKLKEQEVITLKADSLINGTEGMPEFVRREICHGCYVGLFSDMMPK